MLGIDEVYRLGGAQAIAAMALGSRTIQSVDKIVGPGNIYAQLAKKMLYGVVDIDGFAGPSEVLVIADDSANPAFIAADLLAQAEHNPGQAVLVTPVPELIARIEQTLEQHLANLSTADGAASACAISRPLCWSAAWTKQLPSPKRTPRSTCRSRQGNRGRWPRRSDQLARSSSATLHPSRSGTTWRARHTCCPPAAPRGSSAA